MIAPDRIFDLGEIIFKRRKIIGKIILQLHCACLSLLDVYEMPYNPQKPVVYMDEKPYQLLGEAIEPLPIREESNQKSSSM